MLAIVCSRLFLIVLSNRNSISIENNGNLRIQLICNWNQEKIKCVRKFEKQKIAHTNISLSTALK